MFLRLTISSINRSASGMELSVIPVTLAAPSPATGGFRPPTSGLAPGFSSRPSAAPVVIEIPGSFPSFLVSPFIVWSERLLWLLLTSAEHQGTASQFPCTGFRPVRDDRPPWVIRVTFLPYTRRIYFHALWMVIGLYQTRACLPGCGCLVCDFCSSGRDFACGFLQIPPRAGHPCRSANGSHHQGP